MPVKEKNIIRQLSDKEKSMSISSTCMKNDKQQDQQVPCPSISTCASITSGGDDANDNGTTGSKNHPDMQYSGYLRNVYLKFLETSAGHDDEQEVAASSTVRSRLEEWWSNNIGNNQRYCTTAKVLVFFRGPTICSTAVLIGLFTVLFDANYHHLVNALLIFLVGLYLTVLDISQRCQRMYIQSQIFIIRWVDDNLILDTALLTLVQTMKQAILGVASVVGMYALPLSQQRRIEVLDSVFPSERFGEQQLSVSEVLTSRGGVLALLPSKYYQDLILTATKISSTDTSAEENSLIDNHISFHYKDRISAEDDDGGDLVWEGPPFVTATTSSNGYNQECKLDGEMHIDRKKYSQLSIHKPPALSSTPLSICYDIMKECMLSSVKNPVFSFIHEVKDEVLTKVGTTAFFSLILHLYSSRFARQTLSRLLHTASLLGVSGALSTALSMIFLKSRMTYNNSAERKVEENVASEVEKTTVVEEEYSNNTITPVSNVETSVSSNHGHVQQPQKQQYQDDDENDRSLLISNHRLRRQPKGKFALFRWIPIYQRIRGQYLRSLQVGIALLVLALMKRRLLLR